MPAILENLRTAREARATDWASYRSLMDTITAEPTAEQTAQLDQMDAALQTRTQEIERLERALEFERATTTPGTQEPDLPAGGAAGAEYRQAFDAFMRTGRTDGLEYRALAEGTTTAGGYLVPIEFRTTLIERLKAYGGIRAAATVITTSTGGLINYPTADETAAEGEIIGENTATTEYDVSVGIRAITAWTYSSKMQRVPNRLLQDSQIDLEGWLAEKLAERVGRIQARHFVIGTGTGQPQGIQPTATVGVTAASATAITADEVLSLVYALDPAYWPNSRWVFNPATVGMIRKLKATTGEYLWEPSMQTGAPDNLWGYPITVDPAMPVAATGVKSVLFGDIRRAYIIRDVNDTGVRRLTERFAEFDQTAFLMFQRTDAAIQDVNAYKALQQA